MPDWSLAAARSVCRARGLPTQRQAQHIWSQRIFCCLVVGRLAASYRWRHSWQHAIESRAATDGGFIPGGRRSRVLSHSHFGTADIRPAVRCGRERRRKIVVATRAAERPFQRAQTIGRRGAGPAFCSYPPRAATSRQVAHKYVGNSTDNPYGHRAACVGSSNNNGRIARTAAARRTQCRVDTRPGQCGASSLQGGNHAFPHSETVRDLPVRRAQGAGGISKGRQVISRPQETRLQNKRVGARA
jgi:hypothetical protein